MKLYALCKKKCIHDSCQSKQFCNVYFGRQKREEQHRQDMEVVQDHAPVVVAQPAQPDSVTESRREKVKQVRYIACFILI